VVSRVPDRSLSRRLRADAFSLPLLGTVGILLCGLGPLIALAMYYRRVCAVRRHALDAVVIEADGEGNVASA